MGDELLEDVMATKIEPIPLNEITLCVPYYRNVGMLKRQVEEWNKYPPGFRVILVDDCSPEPALPIVEELATPETRQSLEVYRTDVDKPWAREFCRNLASSQAQTEWLLHVDVDHILPVEHLLEIPTHVVSWKTWYRFKRFRVGRADETRKKDFRKMGLADDAEFGEVHPHVDSYLCRRKHYWKIGGYNEQFIGVLGGGNEFLRRAEAAYSVKIFPGDVALHVYTRHAIPDASDRHCSRDSKPGKDLWRALSQKGELRPTQSLTLPWSRVL